jgi:hypothetical protein
MLVRSIKWAEDNFAEGSKPHPKTIKHWVQDKVIEGVIINGTVFVEHDTLIAEKAKTKPATVKTFKLKD